MDLSERLARLEAIAQEYEALKALIEQAGQDQDSDLVGSSIVLYVDPATQRIVDASDAALALLGYSADELSQLALDALETRDENSEVQVYIETSIEIQTYLATYRQRQGQRLPVRVFRHAMTRGQQALLHYRLEDHSLRGRLLNELRRREDSGYQFQKRLKALNEISAELSRIDSFDLLCRQIVQLGKDRLGFDRLGLWFCDLEHEVMVGSYGVDEQGGIRAEHEQRWSYAGSYIMLYLDGRQEALHINDSAPIYNDKSQIIEFGWHISAPIRRGEQFIGIIASDNYLNKRPMKNYEPELLRLYGITIGHLVELFQAREQSFAMRLEQERSQMLKDFIAKVGHDFKTPLATISTRSYLIQRAEMSEKKQSLHQGIQDQISYMSRMLDSMVDFISYEKALVLHRHPTSLPVLMSEILEASRDLITTRQMHCMLDVPQETPQAWVVLADATYLRRALSEIFENALHYTPNGGQIRITFVRWDGETGVRIQDSGVGVSSDALERIFEPLYRADPARTERRSGLGLPIARKIAEAHGGRITVESSPGAGSTFTLLLPLHPPDQAQR